MATAVGIDLGTTNSVIASWQGGEPVVIANAEGARTTSLIGVVRRLVNGSASTSRRLVQSMVDMADKTCGWLQLSGHFSYAKPNGRSSITSKCFPSPRPAANRSFARSRCGARDLRYCSKAGHNGHNSCRAVRCWRTTTHGRVGRWPRVRRAVVEHQEGVAYISCCWSAAGFEKTELGRYADTCHSYRRALRSVNLTECGRFAIAIYFLSVKSGRYVAYDTPSKPPTICVPLRVFHERISGIWRWP